MRRPLVGFFVLLVVFIAAGNYYVFFPLREAIQARELAHLDALAGNVARLTESRLGLVELTLDNAALKVDLDHFAPITAHRHLRAAVEAMPLVRVIGVIDVEGRPLFSSRSLVPPQVDLSERDYIKHWTRGGDGTRRLSGPQLNLVDGNWQISLSKPIERNGRLVAIIVAVINVDLLSVANLALPDPEDEIVMVDSRFSLIDTVPARAGEIGATLADTPLFRSFGNGSEVSVTGVVDGPRDGEVRLAAARRFYDDSLVVAASRSRESALAYWSPMAAAVAGFSALVVGMVVGISLMIRADSRARAAHTAELEKLNRELTKRTAESERLARVKSDFLATMSHEIRTPLTAVMGMLDLSRQSTDLELVHRHLAIADSASRVLLTIINDILDSERLETGRLELEQVPFNLKMLTEQVLTTVRPQADDKALPLDVDISRDSPPLLVGDPMRIAQILINLLGNAVKFTEKGHVELTVRVTGTAPGRHCLRFDVADTGSGIAADRIDRLFRPFEQLEPSRARMSGGSGLGLSICKRLVEAMQGRIGVESVEGVGSRFWFEIELDEYQGVGAVDDGPARPIRKSRPLDILAVDDNAVNRELIREMLASHGHRVVTAGTGLAALDRVAEQEFDAILLDIQMPEMDGVETIRRLHAAGVVVRTAVIAITANAMKEQIEEYAREGFDACVIKPIKWSELLEKMQVTVERKSDGALATPPSDEQLSPEAIDWSFVDEIAGTVTRERLYVLLGNAIDELRSVADRLPLADGDEIGRVIHTAKGIAGNFGIVSVVRALEAYVATAGGGDPARLRSALDEALDNASKDLGRRMAAAG